jgi:ubiquitin carboxyl-terminal hydrolase 10
VSDSSKRNGAVVKGKGKEKKYTVNDPFIPENVYDAMKENKRFDSMRVSHLEIAFKL